MSLGFLESVNWVDLLALLILLRITYMGSVLGVGAQLLSVAAALVTLAVSLYFYVPMSQLLTGKVNLAVSVARFSSFFTIVIVSSGLFTLLVRLIQRERPASLAVVERGVGTVLGFTRSIIVLGLVFMAFVLLPIKGISDSVKTSLSGEKILRWTINIYTGSVNFLSEAAKKDKVVKNDVYSDVYADKDYEIKMFDFDLKEKGRFFKKDF